MKVNQQPAADTSHYTTVQWLDSVVNFGSIKMGEQIEIRFRVRNSGHQPLYLTDVKAVCGCTVADYTRQAISPGDTGIVVGSSIAKKRTWAPFGKVYWPPQIHAMVTITTLSLRAIFKNNKKRTTCFI